jgi:hypothetical protein
MAGLEAVLRITAKDDAGPALAKVKEQIAQLDKSIAVFDKMATSVGKVAKSTDPLLVSINASVRSMNEARTAATELAAGLEKVGGGAETAAGAQRTLGEAVMSTTRLMALQGTEAVKVAEKIVVSQKKAAKEAKEAAATRKEMVGMGGGLVGTMLGFGAAELGVKAIESGATLDQAMAKLRTSGVPDADIEQAKAGYADFSKTHAGMTEAEYLTKYGEARTMSSDPLKTTREMAQLSLALKNSGVETSPDEVRSFIKAVDELSLPPAEQEKLLDRMAKVKQLYGANITGETWLAAQRRSSMSAYGWDDKFRDNYFPFMLQSLGVTSGNDMMTAYSNYVGKHMQHTEMMNLAKYGFIRPQDEVINKAGTIKGLKPGAQVWEESLMKANPAQFAWDMHQKFMSRKGATEDQFTSFVGTLPRAMGAMIEFFTHGQGLAARDLALGKNPVGLAAAGNEYAAKNPMAALDALRTSIEQFGAALTSGPVMQASAQLVALAQHVTDAAAIVDKFEKAHPGVAKAGTYAAEGAGGLFGLGLIAAGAKWLGRTALGGFGLGGLFGGGGGAGGAAAAGGGATAAAAGAGRGILGGVLAGASLPGLIDLLTDDNRTPGAKANDAAVLAWGKSLIDKLLGPSTPQSPAAGAPEHHWGPWHAGGSPAGPIITDRPFLGRDPHSPQSGPYSYSPKGAESISVSGQAQVEHTVHVDVSLEPGLMAKIEQAANSIGFTVPLIGGGTGRMDSDAGAHRTGGIGSM